MLSEKIIPIRPHHGMCLAFFKGCGYSEGFTGYMQEMLDIFRQNVSVKLTVALDEICSACPNHVCINTCGEPEYICKTDEKVERYDRGVLESCGLEENQEMKFLEFVNIVQKKVIESGKREKICGDCQWNEICSMQKSRFEI